MFYKQTNQFQVKKTAIKMAAEQQSTGGDCSR